MISIGICCCKVQEQEQGNCDDSNTNSHNCHTTQLVKVTQHLRKTCKYTLLQTFLPTTDENCTIFIVRDFSYKRTKVSWLGRKVPHLMARHFRFLTCCSCRISSLRASTRFWSSRLSWDNKSVPSSAFNDSLVDSIACKLASKLCKLRCYGTDIRQIHSSKQSVEFDEFHFSVT